MTSIATDKVEYYFGKKLICRISSSIFPQEGQAVSIRGSTYRVDLVSFAVDFADDHERSQHCANVRLVATE